MSLGKIIENAKCMLTNRNYTNITVENLDSSETNEEELYLKCINNDGHEMYIFFYNNDKLNINGIKDYITILKDNDITHSIIVHMNIITSSAKKLVTSLSDALFIELFEFKELTYNLTKHKYYNIHEKLDKKESSNFTNTYGKDIPVILKNDIVSRYFNFKKGDIIRVYRRKNTISYRIVKG